MDFRQLRYLIEIEHFGSINKAAKVLGISQPWLSASMKELENELKFTLFHRTNHGVILTIEGEQFIENAKTLLSQVEIIQNKYNSNASSMPVLKISTCRYSFATRLLIEFLNSDLYKPAAYSIYFDEVDSQTVVMDVYNQKSEVGILHVSAANDGTWEKKLADKQIEHHLLFRTDSYVILRENHPLCSKKDISLEDLFEFPVLRTVGELSFFSHFDQTPDMFPFEMFHETIYTNSRNTVYDILSHTNAIFLGTINLEVESMHAGIVSIPYPDEKPKWVYYWIKTKRKPLSRIGRDFVQILEKYQRQ